VADTTLTVIDAPGTCEANNFNGTVEALLDLAEPGGAGVTWTVA
jgi:hypothetical protein